MRHDEQSAALIGRCDELNHQQSYHEMEIWTLCLFPVLFRRTLEPHGYFLSLQSRFIHMLQVRVIALMCFLAFPPFFSPHTLKMKHRHDRTVCRHACYVEQRWAQDFRKQQLKTGTFNKQNTSIKKAQRASELRLSSKFRFHFSS